MVITAIEVKVPPSVFDTKVEKTIRVTRQGAVYRRSSNGGFAQVHSATYLERVREVMHRYTLVWKM